MNAVRSIAINIGVQNLEAISIVGPNGGLSMFNADTSCLELPSSIRHGAPLMPWKRSHERPSQDRLFQLPEAIFRTRPATEERLPGSMSELQPADYLRYQFGRSQYSPPPEGRTGFSPCGRDRPGDGQNGRAGAETRQRILTPLRRASCETSARRRSCRSPCARRAWRAQPG